MFVRSSVNHCTPDFPHSEDESSGLILLSCAEMSAGVLGSAVDWKAGKAELCAFGAIVSPTLSCRGYCVCRHVSDDRCQPRAIGVNPEWGFNLTRISAQLEEDGYTTVGSEIFP